MTSSASTASLCRHLRDRTLQGDGGRPRIKKTKIKAREFFQTIAEIQFESGYPYILFEDTANRANPIAGRINMSNLCSEILQVNTPSVLGEDLNYEHIGNDISCNLGSLNIATTMDGGNLGAAVETAIRALTAVSEMSSINSVPSVRQGNEDSHAIGLGQMNLHGYLARERIHYDSPEAVEFTSVYFAAVAFHCLRASCLLAQEKQKRFVGFEDSKYATGEYFDKYVSRDWLPTSETVKALFAKTGVQLPTRADWEQLKGRDGARPVQPQSAGDSAHRFDQLHQQLHLVDPPYRLAH